MLGGETDGPMRRFLLLLTLPIAMAPSACWFGGGTSASYELDEYDFTTIDITTIDGNIDVVSGAEYTLEAVFHRTEDTELLEIEEMGDVLVVRSLCESMMCSIDVSVVVPIGTEVIASTAGGEIDVDEIEGGAFLSSVGGAIDATDVEGGLDIDTTSGEVDIRDANEDIVVTTISGIVDATELEADSIHVNTTEGKVSIECELAPWEVMVGTVDGGVEVTVPMDDYDLDLESSSGTIDLYGLEDVEGAARTITVQTTTGAISVHGD